MISIVQFSDSFSIKTLNTDIITEQPFIPTVLYLFVCMPLRFLNITTRFYRKLMII